MRDPAITNSRHWWHREDVLLLAMLAILYLLPGLQQIPLFDRDEPRFAVAARTMMETGDYIVPHFNGQLRPDKPPLVYWLMDIGYTLTGGPRELGARLPSAFCGMLTLIVTYFIAGSRFGRLTGFVSAMMLGSAALFVIVDRMATADGTQLLFITVCMGLAWQAWDAATGPRSGNAAGGGGGGLLPRTDFLLDRSSDRMLMLDHMPVPAQRRLGFVGAMLFWVALAAGTLTKGVPLIFVLVPMVALSFATGALPEQLRQWRSHFHLTAGRTAVSLGIALSVAAVFFAGTNLSGGDLRLWAAIIGILLIGMILTPGLPGVLVRCVFQGNWAWWKSLRPLVGVPLLIVLVGWWVLLAGNATHWQLITDMVQKHFLNRVAASSPEMQHYGMPPGFYLATVWGTFWPWSILIIPAAYHTLRRLRGKTPIAIDPRPYQFLLAWIVPMWILLELARGKLFHYPLPLFVPLAILCADTLVQSWHRLTDVLAAAWFMSMRWGMLLLWLGMGVAVLGAARAHPDPMMLWRCFPFAACLMATGAVSAITWGKPSWPYVMVLAWGGSLLVADTLLLGQMPELQVSRIAAAEMVDARKSDPRMKFGVLGYEEATLVFYAGDNVKRFDSVDEMLQTVPFAPEGDPAPQPWVIVIDDAVRAKLDAAGVRYARVPRADLPATLQNADAYLITGIDTGNLQKAVAVSVITNVLPKPALTTSEGDIRQKIP